MSAADVKLGDASIQQFLQSDVADRLMKDPQARSLLQRRRLQSHDG